MTPDEGAPLIVDQADDSEALRRVGADDAVLEAVRDLARRTGGRPARVVRADRIRTRISDGHHAISTDADRSRVLDPDSGELGLPVVGDWVAVSREQTPAILAVLPRTGRLVRRDPGAPRPQLLASGVDVVVVTVPLDRPVVIARVERELVTAHDADATPVIVLTKADVGADLEAVRAALAPATSSVEVLEVAAHHGVGVERVRAHLSPGCTGVLLGPSGAGKSTLANALLGGEVHAVAEVRAGDHKGRHTTASRGLHPLPGGGALIDTPGLRALGLWNAHRGLALAFSEISDAATACHFADCTHTSEPGCAVLAAVETGTIDEDRLLRYQTLAEELASADEEAEQADRVRRRREDRGAR